MNAQPFTLPADRKIALLYAAIGIGGVIAVVIALSIARKLKQGAEAAGSALGGVIADIVVGGTDVSVNAAVRIPNLGVVPFDVIVAEGSALTHEGGEVFTFRYRGIKYRVVPPRRPDGTYDAVRT